jgi:hypothetical protein
MMVKESDTLQRLTARFPKRYRLFECYRVPLPSFSGNTREHDAYSKASKNPTSKGWPSHVKSGVLHIISLAHFSITHARGWAAKSVNASVRISAENDRLQQDIALLREELRIKEARM